MESDLKALQAYLAEELLEHSEIYRVLDTTLILAIVRVRARRNGLFAGQATFGSSVAKTEWVYGFKVAPSVSPKGVITAFGLASANCDERPIGDFLVAADGHGTFLADKGFSAIEWEKHWLATHGAVEMTHEGSANFIVDLVDDNGASVVPMGLVNDIGPFNGSRAMTVPDDGIYLFSVQAGGPWTIQVD